MFVACVSCFLGSPSLNYGVRNFVLLVVVCFVVFSVLSLFGCFWLCVVLGSPSLKYGIKTCVLLVVACFWCFPIKKCDLTTVLSALILLLILV